jgi:CDP-6-deoxy-D-xylo-4-hexulose-3-dehydrase
MTPASKSRLRRPKPRVPSTRALRRLIERCAGESLAEPFDPAHPRVRLHEPTYGAAEVWEALESLLSTRVTAGEKVRGFERAFAERFALGRAVMVNSGSSANLLAIAALCNPELDPRLGPGDEVIVPALSWSTSVWPLIQHGLVPVVVDIDPRTLNIDPAEAERAVGPRTRGVLLVHVYGNPCELGAIGDLVRRRSLVLVEDCCEAVGARYEGRSVGSFGRIGTFSFYFSHHITTLEGGMAVTAEPALADLLRILRAHGWIRECDDAERYVRVSPHIDPKFLFVNLGYNVRATDLQGGIGRVQLERLEGFLQIRRENARAWSRDMTRWGEWFEAQQETPGGRSSWFGFPMVVREGAPFSVGELRAFLGKRGIETRPLIAGNMAAQPGLRRFPHRVVGDLRHADHVMRNGFTFGNHQGVDVAARRYVSDTIDAFLRAGR